MKIQCMHFLYIILKFWLVAKRLKTRILYVVLTYGSVFDEIVHRLSTGYINIWYACASLDTIYTCR